MKRRLSNILTKCKINHTDKVAPTYPDVSFKFFYQNEFGHGDRARLTAAMLPVVCGVPLTLLLLVVLGFDADEKSMRWNRLGLPARR